MTFLRNKLKDWRHELGLDRPPSTGVREALQYFMMSRLAFAYVILLVVVAQQMVRGRELTDARLILPYALLALSFTVNLVQALGIERIPARWGIAVLNIIFDAVLTSSWIYLSGSEGSLFALLYLVQILFHALIFYLRGAVVGALCASIGFGVVCWLRPPEGGVVLWGIYTGLFLTLGFVGGYLSEELLRATESLRAESRKIEKLQQLQEDIINNLPTGLMTVDGGMRVQYLNPAAEQILGWRLGEISGRPLEELEKGLLPFFTQIEAEDIEEEEFLEEGGETGPALSRPRSEFAGRVFAHPRSNEKTRLQQTVEVGHGVKAKLLRGDVAALEEGAPLGRLLEGGESRGARVLLFQDVTKLVHLEDKLRQNEKLAAVGQLAAGIAHEIRNPLASMSGSIQMLRGSLGEVGAENRKLMDIAVREIDRLNNLISEFLDFVKPARPQISAVAVEGIVEDLVLQARNLKEFKAQIRLETQVGAGTVVLANGEKLKQVLWNLVVNAVQAMDKPGRVEVGAITQGNRVRIWVEDEGKGMDESVQGHLFEPFFTTKERGTGLGLATAYKIIEALHGEIRVQSRPGQGTRFEVVLPCA